MPFGGGGVEQEVAPQLVEVVRGDLIISVSGSGSIGVDNEASLAFDGSGKVDKIYVDEGDEVSKGQSLAELVPLDTEALELALTQAQVTLKQAQVALATAEYNLGKAQEIYREADIHKAQVAVSVADHYLRYAKERLASANVNIETWANEVYQAELDLARARQELEIMLSGGDAEEVALRKLEVDAAELQVDAAKQAVEEAQRQLETETITAPFNGVVTSVNVEEGDIISSPSMSQVAIVHLIDLATMELGVDLDEIDIPGVALEQRAIISVDALPDVQLEGRVTHISPLPTVEAGVTLYKVKIGFDVPEGSGLRVGMSATADIITSERSGVLLVPNRAIKQDSQGNPVVWVMVGEQTEQRPVVVGISDGFQTEIVQGLNEGETVVEAGAGVQPSPEPSGGGGFLFR
jgi:HlyD family secretion protein